MRVDELVDELRTDGVTDSTGAFSLDREAARKKLAEAQLEDPYRYVLLLVQAAVLKGATGVACDVRVGGFRLEFDGRPFSADDLEQLYENPFTATSDADLRARQELALGVSSALGRLSRSISITSGDGKQGHALKLRPGTPDAITEVSPAPTGTVIEVTYHRGVNLLKRACLTHLRNRPEELILRDRCRFADIEILVNGRNVADGLCLPRIHSVVPVDGVGIRGEAGFANIKWSTPVRSSLILVQNGVWISTEKYSDLPDPDPEIDRASFVAVVESEALRKDLSQFRFVHDDVMQEIATATVTAFKKSRELAWASDSNSIGARSVDFPDSDGNLPRNDTVVVFSFFATAFALIGVVYAVAIANAALSGTLHDLDDVRWTPLFIGANLLVSLILTLVIRRGNGIDPNGWWIGAALPLSGAGAVLALLALVASTIVGAL